MRRPVLCTLLGAMLLCGVAAGTPADTTADADTADGNVTVYRAQSIDLESTADVQSGIENGSIEHASRLLVDETLVVELESDRLATELEARNASPTEAVFDVLGSSNTGSDENALFLSEQDLSPGRRPNDVRLGPANTTAYRSGNVTYVLVDIHSVAQKYDTDNRLRRPYGVQWGTPDWAWRSDDPPVRFYSSTVDVRWLSDGDPLPNERIRRGVDVNIEPEAPLEAHLELEGGETRTDVVEPAEWTIANRGFSVDLSDVDHGTAYTLEFRREGRSVRTITGVVQEPHARLEVQDATATGNESRRNGSTAIEAAVELSHGGEVRVTNSTSESTLAVERVGPDEKRDLTLPLSDASPSENQSFYIHLEREPPALDAHYPDGSPAAVVHENGSVTQYVADFEVPTTTIVDDSTAAENTTSTDGGVADEPSRTDGSPGFTVVVTATVILVFARRISRHA